MVGGEDFTARGDNDAGGGFGGPVETVLPPGAGDRPNVMDPLDVGRLVVEGIKENRPYIHTHLNVKPWIEERFTRMLTGFEPVDRLTAAAPWTVATMGSQHGETRPCYGW